MSPQAFPLWYRLLRFPLRLFCGHDWRGFRWVQWPPYGLTPISVYCTRCGKLVKTLEMKEAK